MLAAYAILVICNVVLEARSYIAEIKNNAIEAMLLRQHLVTHFTCAYITSLTSKNIKLCFYYYENWLKLTPKQ